MWSLHGRFWDVSDHSSVWAGSFISFKFAVPVFSFFCFLWYSVQHRFNLTKTVRKFPINSHLQRIGQEVHPGPVPNINSHGDAQDEEDIPYEQLGEGAVDLNQNTFDLYALRYDLLLCQFIDVVHFFHFLVDPVGCNNSWLPHGSISCSIFAYQI